MSYYPTFKDGKTTIDFILVFRTSSILTEITERKHKNFLEGLEKLGLKQEKEHFSMWTIFIEENTIEVVPISWVLQEKLLCYWPDDKKSMPLRTKISGCEPQDKNSWNVFKIRFPGGKLRIYNDYLKARINSSWAEDHSEFREAELPKIRKRKKTRLSSSSPAESDDIIQMPKFMSGEKFRDKKTLPSSASSIEQLSHKEDAFLSTLSTQVREPDKIIERTTLKIPQTQVLQPYKNYENYRDSETSKTNQKLLCGLSKELSKINQKIDFLHQDIQHFLMKMRESDTGINDDLISKFLLRNEEELQHFEEYLLVLGNYTNFVDEDVVFIKLHAPDSLVMTYGGLFDIDLACQTFDYRPYVAPPSVFFASPLTNPNVNDPIYARAPETISGEIPKKITSAERIMVVNQILNRCVWGEGRGEYGIHKLKKANVFIDSFPLHDGDYKWTVSGPLNDRQLLALYWGSAHCWSKAQPLNLIEKYFGTEYALYFAWLGMYIKLLLPAAGLSIFVIIYGILTFFTPLNKLSQEICSSNVVMCPRCHFSKCPREYLSSSCYMANMTYFFDNWCAVVFSAVMSLWATIFMEVWQREESVLRLQWNLKSLEHTISVRPEFIERATKKRYSPITGKMEPYVPKTQTVLRYIVSLVSVALLLIIMSIATFSVMVYRVTINAILAQRVESDIITKKLHRNLIASTTGGLMSGFFIFLFKFLYEKVALDLNNLENHRTWNEYNDAFIYKSFALAFVNNYAAVFYIAFFKGKFFTHPGDLHLVSYLGGVNTDVCDPTGCIVDLAILLVIIMSLKAIANNVTQVVVPKMKNKIKKEYKYKIKTDNIPQWEQEYLMTEAEEFFIDGEYMDMGTFFEGSIKPVGVFTFAILVIQYGFVNFFIMGFPLAPLLALLNNIGELRVDASKVTKSYRRPIPNRVVGLGAWFGILQAMTYIGVVTNALVIAFTSNYMEKVIFKSVQGDRNTGFLNQTLSMFNSSEFQMLDNPVDFSDTPICYYQGKRYPPGHKLRYQRRQEYWHHLGIKFGAVVIFEHVVIIIKGLLAYAIPDVPFSVKQQVVYQEKINKKKKVTAINEAYLKKRENLQKTLEERRAKEKQEMTRLEKEGEKKK